jgi:hypothetical protein
MIVADDAVLATFRLGPCEICDRPGPTDPHHAHARGLGGGSRLDIPECLCALCRRCHNAVEAGLISRRIVWLIIERRLGLAPGQAQERVWEMLRRPKAS